MPAPKDPEKRRLWIEKIRKHHSSEEFKAKMRKVQTGRHHSIETKRKIGLASVGRKPNLGKHHSEETKRKMSEAHSGENAYWFGKKFPPEYRKKLSESHKGQVTWNKGKHGVQEHSVETRKKIGKAMQEIQLGANNSNWKGGITSWILLIRNSVIYDLWRRAVFYKDNFRCQDCDQNSSGDLHAHHLTPFAKLIQDYNITSFDQAIRTVELWDINNGITLCVKCHKKRHSLETKETKMETIDAKKTNLSGTVGCAK